MTSVRENFGAFIRHEREAREISLRQMAKLIGVSPAYMSKVERAESTPPTEDKVRSIAQILECDPDELLAMAGRVPSDLAEIVNGNPTAARSALLRIANGLKHDGVPRQQALDALRRFIERTGTGPISPMERKRVLKLIDIAIKGLKND